MDYELEEKLTATRHKAKKQSTEEYAKFKAALVITGFVIEREWELPNGYWPPSPRYDDVRTAWWLFLTDVGPIQIGWRKRVINVDWSATKLRGIVTLDNVTKWDEGVHAYSYEKLTEYLFALHKLAMEKS